MIAVDTNILIYAHQEASPRHIQAKERLSELAEGKRPWGLPVFVLGEFLRLITHPRLFHPPFSAEEGVEALRRLLASPSLQILYPGSEYAAELLRAVQESGMIGNLVFDAQLVAVCRENGVERLLTEDRDFERFRDLEIVRL